MSHFVPTLLFAAIVASISPTVFSKDTVTKESVDLLVEQLASKNPMPREVDGSTAAYPPKYNKKLQKPIYEAYRQLNQLGVAAFPHLIPHFDDQRYALTADGGSMDINFTVGNLCYYLVELQIQPDKGWTVGEGDPRFRTFRPHFPQHIKLREKEAAMKWWEENKTKSLTEIQILVTEWAIAEEAKRPTEYTDEERSALAKTLDKLRKTNKPIPSTVPWFK